MTSEPTLVYMLNYLRREDGSAVTLPHDNHDLNGPNNSIDCYGAWTKWKDCRFTGETLHEVVRTAYLTKLSIAKGSPKQGKKIPVMVEIKTWNTGWGSAIRSIGACTFDPSIGGIGEEFYHEFAVDVAESSSLEKILDRFTVWYADMNGNEVWSYDAIPRLETAYAACKRKQPWTPQQLRCVRTTLALAKIEISEMRNYYGSLDNARLQVDYVCKALSRLTPKSK